jgi:hypothetical protein
MFVCAGLRRVAAWKLFYSLPDLNQYPVLLTVY